MPGAVTKGRKQYEGMEKSDRGRDGRGAAGGVLGGLFRDGTYSADMAEYAYEKGGALPVPAYEDTSRWGGHHPGTWRRARTGTRLSTSSSTSLPWRTAPRPRTSTPRRMCTTFEATDQLVEYGQANGKTVRGHTLVWYSQCPEWFSWMTRATRSAPRCSSSG